MTITDHLQIAAGKTGVPIADIIGPSRKAYIYRARFHVWRELRMKGFSFEEIGQATNRCHSAVAYAFARDGAKQETGANQSRIDNLERTVASLEGQVAQLLSNEERYLTETIDR